jgi:tetratricopeptide (TPR) repeat protein
MADAFLSYARSNAKAANLVAEALRAAGYSVWFDENLPAHRAYSEVIEEQLESAGAVLALWSIEAVRSQWVRSEANRARETGRLIQIRLDDARLPLPFDQIQCSNLSGWRGDPAAPAWQNVLSSVAALADREPTSGRTERVAAHGALNRRDMLIGGSAVAAVGVVAAGGFTWWRAFVPKQPSPEAQLLLEKGTNALQTDNAFDPKNPAAAAQAVAILTSATRLAPDFAAAWGELAMAYAVRKKGAPPQERAGFDSRSRSAAKRALDLDPNEPRAIGALRLLDPVYRNWLAAERADRKALRVEPRFAFFVFLLAYLLGSVGRWREAAALSRKFDRTRFLIAGADRQVIINLWSAGDLPGADDAIRAAVDHWPQHPLIWGARISYLTYSGRPSEALELLGNQSERPPGTTREVIDAFEATAAAMAGRASAADAVDRNLALLKLDPATVFAATHAATALGDAQTALALLRGYFFGETEWARLAPVGGDPDRQTAFLFQPPMRNLWRNQSFDALLERIGLNAYWRQSNTLPDFRN